MNKHNADQPSAGSEVAKSIKPTEQVEKKEQCQKEKRRSDKNLSLIEAVFHDAGIDDKQGLDKKKFREVMKTIMGDVKDEDLDGIFMKVDANCDGTVKWEECKNYMQLEHEAKDSMQKSVRPLYFPKPIKVLRHAHCKAIVALQFYPFQKPQGEKRDSGGFEECAPKPRIQPGHYLSITQDGILSYWSERFKLLHSVNLDNLKQMHAELFQKIWVTDMICLRNIDLLAISSTSLHLEFYDISARKCDLAFTLTGLDCSVTVMDYWSDGKKGVFTYGDVNGCVTVFTSADVIHNGLFNRGTSKTVSGGDCQITVADLQKNSCGNYHYFKVALHKNWCQQIHFLPKLNVIATCSATDQTAMVLTSFPDSYKSEVHNTVFHLQKGIMCFDYSPDLNILVTGGLDRIVRVWSPYVTKRSCQQMKGHISVITHILVNGRDKKVISISKDKNLRVWDLQDCSCLQNIRSNEVSMGRPPITGVFYNRDTNTLVVATCLVGVLQGAVEDVNMIYKAKTHKEPLCASLYNTNFKQVVSGCHDGVVCVWDIMTGEKVMQFQTCPRKPVEVTAMAFDTPQRRLITGSYDGTVRIWNFNNGALLLQVPLVDKTEVTSILHINKRIYVSGWSKRIICYKDVRRESQMDYYVWNHYHSEDIFCMHAYGTEMVATASYSGDTIIWSTSSKEPLCRLNASESPRLLICDPGVGAEEKQSCGFNPISPEELAKPTMAVEKALFLSTRNHSPDTAILLTSTAHGYVYAWSVCKGGGLLGKFRATRTEDTAITTLATNPGEQTLLAGDSKGVITLWDIENYCYCMSGKRDEKEEESTREKTLGQSNFIPKDGQEGLGKVVWGGLRISFSSPKLLNSWRCHGKRIVHLEYVESLQLIVTASLDCNVRLWTFTGVYIGTFGQVQWYVDDPDTFPKELPADLRMLGCSETPDELDEPHENYEDGDQETLAPSAPDTAATAGSFSGGAALEPTEPAPPEPGMPQCTDEEIEETWIQWQKHGKKSRILGQAYKPKVKNLKPPCRPDLSTSSGCNETLRVSKFLPCTPLVPVTVPSMPEILKKQQKNQECAETTGKQKYRKKCTMGKQQHKDQTHTTH
ncbi:WD repeat-containing protein on Y chromosome-like [Megalops cyprinoides]|uniref:WD repeat-containing protein on Y chromosome-like n=1 Tax=Megalops cyprinoides TaxID=118141 RepID=UPI00186456A1|nr:WD repeat-containing protein on Y chromosome-like [Megalops cyprinoides]